MGIPSRRIADSGFLDADFLVLTPKGEKGRIDFSEDKIVGKITSCGVIGAAEEGEILIHVVAECDQNPFHGFGIFRFT